MSQLTNQDAISLMIYYAKAALLGLCLAVAFWVFETLIHVFVMHPHYTFMQELLPVDVNELRMRSLTSFLFFLFTIVAAYLFKSKIQITNQLKLAYAALNNIREAAMIVNAKNEIIYINPRYTQITGYLPEEALGKNPNIVSSGKHNKRFYTTLWSKLNKYGFWEGEIWNRKKTGELYPEWITITTLKDSNGTITNYIAIFSDISLRKASEDKMKNDALHDPLTKLLNRRLFTERLEYAIKTAKRQNHYIAILFIDLDHFKAINDQYGHMVGDAFLCEIAHIIQGALRESDTIARFGGDEFVVLLPSLSSPEAADAIANHLSSLLKATTIQAYGTELKPAVSIGGALYPKDALTAEMLITAADKAMYAVKASGRNGIQFAQNNS